MGVVARLSALPLSGQVAGATALGGSVLAAATSVVRLLPFDLTRNLPMTVDLAIWAVSGAAFIAFMLDASMAMARDVAIVRAQPAAGVETFVDADDLLSRIAELTVGAINVSTINLSPPSASSEALAGYYSSVDAYITAGAANGLKSFRSITEIEQSDRSAALSERVTRLTGAGKVSLAAFRSSVGVDTGVPLCFHIVRRPEGCYSFVFPPIALSGAMTAFCIAGEPTFQSLSQYFDRVWNDSGRVDIWLEGGNSRRASPKNPKGAGASSTATYTKGATP